MSAPWVRTLVSLCIHYVTAVNWMFASFKNSYVEAGIPTHGPALPTFPMGENSEQSEELRC